MSTDITVLPAHVTAAARELAKALDLTRFAQADDFWAFGECSHGAAQAAGRMGVELAVAGMIAAFDLGPAEARYFRHAVGLRRVATRCESVLAGWQSADAEGTFGPAFNDLGDLWAWQRLHASV